jgi:hypothetical protein
MTLVVSLILCIVFRTLLYKLMTEITNGDKIVLDKLDTCIAPTGDDENDQEYSIMIDNRNLVDGKKHGINLVKDLLDLPQDKSSPLLHHPVITTFIQYKWSRVWWTLLISSFLYLAFVIYFSIYLWMMYARYSQADLIRIPVNFPTECDPLRPILSSFNTEQAINFGLKSELMESSDSAINFIDDDDFEVQLEVIKVRKNRTKVSRVMKKLRFFNSCGLKKNGRLVDPSLCSIEICLVFFIAILLVQEVWQCMSLGRQYARELENWFELVILSFAISTLVFKENLDALKILSSVGICLAWIELIFLFGRYPFLGKLSDMLI